jgi:hypothetical protein
MQEKEWTRAFGRCNSWSTLARKLQRRNDRAGRKTRREGAPGTPGRSAQAGRPTLFKEPPTPVFCRQASLSFLCLCVQVCVPKTSVDIANLPKLDSSKKSTTLIHSKSTSRSKKFKCLVTGCNPEF